MHRTDETNLSSITDDFEKLRECFGQWVNLSIEPDHRVIVTSAQSNFFKMGPREVKLGELCKDSSKQILQKINLNVSII